MTFIARGAHLAAIRERGLALRSALGDALIRPAQASDDPAAIGPVDVVIFAVIENHSARYFGCDQP